MWQSLEFGVSLEKRKEYVAVGRHHWHFENTLAAGVERLQPWARVLRAGAPLIEVGGIRRRFPLMQPVLHDREESGSAHLLCTHTKTSLTKSCVSMPNA